ncbi:MAG: hypothetical protein ACOH2K_03930 [Burkholderiaceae bacterium]
MLRTAHAALPHWAAQNYVNHDYVGAKRINRDGLTGRLFAACLPKMSEKPYFTDFVSTTRESCDLNLGSVKLL